MSHRDGCPDGIDIRRLRDVIRDIEDAIDEGGEPGIVQAAEMARYEAEGFRFAMDAWSAR